MRISQNIAELTPSATMAVAALARELRAQGRDIIDLSAGEPDFRTPDFIGQAGIAAITNGETRYTPPAGLPALRQAIASSLERRYGRPFDPKGVVVTAGAKQAIFNACFVLFGPGDKVLLPAPYWTSYPELVKLSRAEPVIVPGREDRGFKIGPDELDAVWDERVRGLILNSPSNPAGTVYTRQELEAIARWAAEREVWILSDEIYSRIHFAGEGPAAGLLDLDPAIAARGVVIDGASKAFAMTGWRIGFSYSDPVLAGHMAALQSHTTSNAAAPSQHAAIAAYSAEPLEEEAIAKMVEVFRQRRDLLVELFRERLPDVPYVHPDGAFYLFFRADAFYSGDATNSVTFCSDLLDRAGVALVPGAAFGDDRYVRLSFAASEEALDRAVARMAKGLAR